MYDTGPLTLYAFRIQPEFLDLLKELAALEGRAVSDLIRTRLVRSLDLDEVCPAWGVDDDELFGSDRMVRHSLRLQDEFIERLRARAALEGHPVSKLIRLRLAHSLWATTVNPKEVRLAS